MQPVSEENKNETEQEKNYIEEIKNNIGNLYSYITQMDLKGRDNIILAYNSLVSVQNLISLVSEYENKLQKEKEEEEK